MIVPVLVLVPPSRGRTKRRTYVDIDRIVYQVLGTYEQQHINMFGWYTRTMTTYTRSNSAAGAATENTRR